MLVASRDAYHSVHCALELYRLVERDAQYCLEQRLDAPKASGLQRHINFALQYNLHDTLHHLRENLVKARLRFVDKHGHISRFNIRAYLDCLEQTLESIRSITAYQHLLKSTLTLHQNMYHEAQGLLTNSNCLPANHLENYTNIMTSTTNQLDLRLAELPQTSSPTPTQTTASTLIATALSTLTWCLRHYIPLQIAISTLQHLVNKWIDLADTLHIANSWYVTDLLLLSCLPCLLLVAHRFFLQKLEHHRVSCRNLLALGLCFVLLLAASIALYDTLSLLVMFLLRCFIEATLVAARDDKYVLFSLVWYLSSTFLLQRFPLCKFLAALCLTHTIYLSPQGWWQSLLNTALTHLHPFGLLFTQPQAPASLVWPSLPTLSPELGRHIVDTIFVYASRLTSLTRLTYQGTLLEEIKHAFLVPRPVIESTPIQLYYESSHVFADRLGLYQQKHEIYQRLLKDWSNMSLLTFEHLATISLNAWNTLLTLRDSDCLVQYLLSPMLQPRVALRDRAYYIMNMVWLTTYALQPAWNFILNLLELVTYPLRYALTTMYTVVFFKQLTERDERLYENLLQDLSSTR